MQKSNMESIRKTKFEYCTSSIKNALENMMTDLDFLQNINAACAGKETFAMLLSRCCFCCSLKYGYFAYAILSMASRLMACVSLYQASHIFFLPYSSASRYGEITHMFVSHGMSIYGGWVITSVVSLFFTMKGIVQKRSILIYPHIVVLVVELTGLIFSVILLIVVVASTYFLIVLPFAIAILGYELWCLISLYKQFKNNERMRYSPDTEPLKVI